ncbi:YdeI/OmpD-associated family protein [Flexivirga alba]|uniref:YdeI family protein n=1 Tax=Flexivirga alba TaxID=702742 RepID=A0ABW2AFY8_9MICO
MAKDITPGRMGGTPERPARFFADAAEFGAWLAAHHDTETELWMGLAKKHVPDRGLTWAQAVPEALCWGWIDSVSQRIDDDFLRQRWTPRKRTSHWSKVNLELVEQLRAAGRMQPAGLAIWEARRREAAPYSHEREGPIELPPAYAELLANSPAATAFLEAATATYRRQCINWVVTAKQEVTRDRRMVQLVECSAAGEVVPFQRYGDLPKWVQRAAAAAAAAGA